VEYSVFVECVAFVVVDASVAFAEFVASAASAAFVAFVESVVSVASVEYASEPGPELGLEPELDIDYRREDESLNNKVSGIMGLFV
jgi:hypothetical protein